MEVAVICRLELFSERAENTVLHRDSRMLTNTLSSKVRRRKSKQIMLESRISVKERE